MQLSQPRWLLHTEGGLVLIGSIVAYQHFSGNWWLFALALFVPDLAALGYLVNVRVGSWCYNLVHTSLGPAILLAIAIGTMNLLVGQIALIWLTHIGLDRLMGFGLKYPTRFQDTHLQHV